MCYFIFLIFVCVSILMLRVSTKGEQDRQVKTLRKKIVVFSVLEKEPIARVVRELESSKTFFDWMRVKDAAIVREEEISKLNNQDRWFNVYLQYRNCSLIY